MITQIFRLGDRRIVDNTDGCRSIIKPCLERRAPYRTRLFIETILPNGAVARGMRDTLSQALTCVSADLNFARTHPDYSATMHSDSVADEGVDPFPYDPVPDEEIA